MSAAVGPSKPGSGSGSAAAPKMPLPSAPPGAMSLASKTAAVKPANGQANGAAVNAAAANMKPPALPPKPIINKPVALLPNDSKSAPGAAQVSKVAEGAVVKVADGKAAPAPSPAEARRAQLEKLATDIQKRAILVADDVYDVFMNESADLAVIHHQTGTYPEGTQGISVKNKLNGTSANVYYRSDKLLKDAQVFLNVPLTATEQKFFAHVLKASAERIQRNEGVVMLIGRAEPGVPVIQSKVVQGQVAKIIKKYPL